MAAMRLQPCSSCARPVQRDVACPFCGAGGVPTAAAPRAVQWLLSVPVLAMSAGCADSGSKPEPAATQAPAVPPAVQGASTPEPPQPAKADPPPPGEPQNELYGTPEMMGEPEPREEPAPEAPAKPDPK